MYTNIIIASGPVIAENGKVLLNQHGDNAFWKFCGGRVEFWNKNLMENAALKAKEEMGIKLKFLENEPFLTYAQTKKDVRCYDVILAHFLAKRIGKIKPGKEIKKWAWIDISHLPNNLAPNIIPVLKHYKLI